ncbi:MAG: hypothetical protein V1660_00585 [archaeon]
MGNNCNYNHEDSNSEDCNPNDYVPPFKPYLPADAVSKEAKPGSKAGNPNLDGVLEEIRRDSIVKRFKDLYTKIFKKK